MGKTRADIVEALQSDILRFEGFKPANNSGIDFGLGPIEASFPNNSFPLGAIHEFLSENPESCAATCAFLTGLIGPLMGHNGTVMWISTGRTLFPPALKFYGVQPDRVIFIDLNKETDVLWAMEEALKCGALTAVVGELVEMSFIASRRLQLAVEQSKVTGFVLRKNIRKVSNSACVSRWKITPKPGEPIDDLPGVGYPQWRVELLRIRNGRCGVWDVRWKNGKFEPVPNSASEFSDQERKVG